MTTISKNMRQLILEKSTELFLERGLDNVRSRDITEAMHISRSHLYHYFSSIKALKIEACEQFLKNETHYFRNLMVELPHDKKFVAFVDYYLPDRKDNSWYLYSDVLHKAQHDTDYALLAGRVHGLWLMLLSEIFTERHPCSVVPLMARTVLMMLNGYASTLMLSEYAGSTQEAHDDVLDLITRLSGLH